MELKLLWAVNARLDTEYFPTVLISLAFVYINTFVAVTRHDIRSRCWLQNPLRTHIELCLKKR